MSKIKELFGVEVGEKFNVVDTETNEIMEKNCYFNSKGDLKVVDKYISMGTGILLALCININSAKIVKIKTPILTPDEHDYLQAVCNPKYRTGKIVAFKKIANHNDACCLEIYVTKGDIVFSFDFDTDSVFKGMELDKRYTPEELGIKL